MRAERATRRRAPGRLVHLAEDQARLGQDPGGFHLFPQVIAFPRPLSDPRKDRVAAVLCRDVVDQLLDDDRLAHPGAAEQPRFAAADIGAEEIDHLDPRLEDLRLGLELTERDGRPVDGHPLLRGDGPLAVHGVPQKVEDPAEHLGSHGHGDRGAGVDNCAPPRDAVRGIQGHRAYPVASEVLLDLAHQARLLSADLPVDHQGVADLGDLALAETPRRGSIR